MNTTTQKMISIKEYIKIRQKEKENTIVLKKSLGKVMFHSN